MLGRKAPPPLENRARDGEDPSRDNVVEGMDINPPSRLEENIEVSEEYQTADSPIPNRTRDLAESST